MVHYANCAMLITFNAPAFFGIATNIDLHQSGYRLSGCRLYCVQQPGGVLYLNPSKTSIISVVMMFEPVVLPDFI